MSTSSLILGESGTGKSASIRTLDSKETFIINVMNKSLPFPGGKESYMPCTKETPEGNLFVTDKADAIISYMIGISQKRPEIKTIIVDDFQYVMANEYMRRGKEKGYDKFTEIGQNAWNIIMKSQQLRDDLIVIFLSHSEETDLGKTKCKTIGKMLDQTITVEGMFTIVMQTVVQDGEYLFSTKNNGRNTVKTPMGMFESEYIENDLNLLITSIRSY